MLPPYDTRTTLSRLGALMERYAPARVIALGDSFHDRGAAYRLDAYESERLIGFGSCAGRIWIAGNHDPALPPWLGGTVCDAIAIGGLIFRHEPALAPAAGENARHLH